MSHAEPARQHYTLTFAVLALSGAAFALLQSLVAPALPTIQHDLHTSATSATWVLTAYLLSAAVFTPIIGRLGDMYGKERMLVIVLGVAAAAMTHLFVPESPIKTPGQVNWAGAGLLSAWLVCLLLGISEGASWGWGSPRVVALLAATAVFAALWVRNEQRAAEPLVDIRM